MTAAETLLTEIRDAMRELVAALKTKAAAKPSVAWSAHEKTIASDAELDHPFGDPQILTAPRDWNGPFTPGQRMSESHPDMLELVAERCDYFAQKNDREKAITEKGFPKSKSDRAKAAKARGWAARLRKGFKPPAPPPMDETPEWGDDSAPF